MKVFDTNTWSATAYGFQGLGDDKYSISFIDNDTKLAVGGNGNVEVVDLATGASLRVGTVSGRAWEMAWNQTTGHLAVGTGSGNVYVFASLAPVDTQAPTISVAVPSDGQVTSAATITTTGRVSDNSSVTSFTINGASVPMDATGPYRLDLSAVDSSPNANARTVAGAAGFTVAEPPPPGLDFYTVQPCRAADTRTGAALSSQIPRYIRLAGLCGIPATARSVSVNLTVVNPRGGGHVTLWPADLARPTTSSINFSAGQIRANNAILPLATDGLGDVAAEAFIAGGGSVHLMIDVNGYFQ